MATDVRGILYKGDMAKKQTRRSISVSRGTYERLKAFCEANHVSMSQFVETRVGDFLGEGSAQATLVVTSAPSAPAPTVAVAKPAAPPARVARPDSVARPEPPVIREVRATVNRPAPVPMSSVAARFAFDPPPPVIRPKQEQPAPKPAEKRPEQIFTF